MQALKDTTTRVDSIADNDNGNALMLAYANGDATAFDQLYARHSQPLLQFIANSCGSQADAQELFQDVWMKVINQRDKYDSATPFKPWLFTIARNTIIDLFRANKRRATTNLGFDEPRPSVVTTANQPLEPDEIARIMQSKQLLMEALQLLTKEQRETVLLKHVAGFSIKEIAKLQTEKAETVKSRLRYAFARLRQTLRDTNTHE